MCNTSEHGGKALALSLAAPQERGFATTWACQMGSWTMMQKEQGEATVLSSFAEGNTHTGNAERFFFLAFK